MSKKIDTTKLERIYEASVAIISEHGITNSSVAAIAKRAGVSVGYLYRHYPGKAELINHLLETELNLINDRIDTLLCEKNDLEAIVGGVVEFIVEKTQNNQEKSKFVIMLLNDFSIEIHDEIRQRINKLSDKLLELSKHTPGIRSNLTFEDLYIAMVSIPLQYMLVHYKFNVQSSPQMTGQIVDISLRVIKS